MRRFTSLIALSALAALALAPAHAMAVANNPSAGECRAPGAGDTVVLIGGQLCAANQGSGGNAGTGAGALPGGRQPGEVVWVTGEIPVCFRNSARCLPGQIGGRGGRQEIGDGPGSGGPRGGAGSRSAGRSETAKGERQRPPTMQECKEMEENDALPPSVVEELEDLQRQIDRTEKAQAAADELIADEGRRIELLDELLPKWLISAHDVKVDRDTILVRTLGDLALRLGERQENLGLRLAADQKKKRAERKRAALSLELEALKQEKERVRQAGVRSKNRLLRQCGALHDD